MILKLTNHNISNSCAPKPEVVGWGAKLVYRQSMAVTGGGGGGGGGGGRGGGGQHKNHFIILYSFYLQNLE